ncbi:HAD hydrolase subfamily IA REG-2-like protein [Ramaria rubella]|nr:HAD hydrolase subfamily IA REG-2-like protein [Ramaria rubella]
MATGIRLVLFDALHTLITPRLPIHVQYAQVFEPHLGRLEPSRVQSAFKTALKDIQREKPVYAGGAEAWWWDVIRQTAVGAGADPQEVDASLATIVPQLMQRFSGKEGYRAFDDVVPTLEALRIAGIRTGLVSNTDLRMKNVIVDLGLSNYLDPLLISEEEGVEKPALEVWERACARAGVRFKETVHVGDELECSDYHGARRAGVHALLLRRAGPDGVGERKERDEHLEDVEIVRNLNEVVAWTVHGHE